MFKIGTKLYINNAGNGAIGCNNCTGIVIDLENENESCMHGIFKEDEGFLIKLDKDNSIWRVHNEGNNNAHYTIIEEKLYMCNYCSEENKKYNLEDINGIHYDKKSNIYYFIVEQFKNECIKIEIKYCPLCGKKLT